MIAELREVANTRRSLPGMVARALLPLEEKAHDLAVQTSELSTLLLQSHEAAKLKPDVGLDAITAASQAAALIAEARGRLITIHRQLQGVYAEFWPTAKGPPECPKDC